MRLLLTALLCILLAAPAGMEAAAQGFTATPVEVSSEKVNVKGTVYYLHKVLKGQTLYSISKAYGVSQDIITGANPALADGLKAGMLLYIPEAAAAASMTADTAAVAAGTADTSRTVLSANDTGKSGSLRSRIDKNRKKAGKQEKKYRKYNVKWYETLDDVAVKFNVTREAIIALNGIDTGSDKRIRSVLIPDEEYMRTFRPGEQENEPAVPEREDNTPADQDGIGNILTDGTGNDLPAVTPGESYNSGTYTISIVLPFNASRLTSGLNAYTADFYAGVLTAMADLKERGLFSNFVLNVVDLSRYSSAWELVSDDVLRGSELIIGPISERDMQPVAAYARSKGIPVVSPLDLNTASLAQGNPGFFLFPPQSDLALSHQIDKIASATDRSSITVIYEQGYGDSDLVTRTLSELERRGLPYKTFSYDFLSGRGIDARMSGALDTAAVNRVIIPSLSEAFVTDALRNLSLIHGSRHYGIEVYGMSQWKNFETVELDYFHALDVRLAMSYHINYNTPETKEFIDKYRPAFNTEPTSFAYQGYDILTFFVEAMHTWGKNFPQGIINERKSLLQSDVLFLPAAPGSGCVNQAFKDICFTDGWQIIDES